MIILTLVVMTGKGAIRLIFAGLMRAGDRVLVVQKLISGNLYNFLDF